MNWKEVLKMPPIPNPMPAADARRTLDKYPNNNMNTNEAKVLFEKAIDPSLEMAAGKGETIVTIQVGKLGMEATVALDLIQLLYPREEYKDIWIDSSGDKILFDMSYQGRTADAGKSVDSDFFRAPEMRGN